MLQVLRCIPERKSARKRCGSWRTKGCLVVKTVGVASGFLCPVKRLVCLLEQRRIVGLPVGADTGNADGKGGKTGIAFSFQLLPEVLL